MATTFEDLKSEVEAHALALEDLKAHVQGAVLVKEDLKANAQSVALVRESLKANVQSRDAFAPYLVRYPDPRSGQTNVPVDGAVRCYIRDQHSGVDISKVWVEIDGVTYDVNSDGFSYEGDPWEYCINVRPQTNWSYEQTVNVRVYAEDLAGNPGLQLETV